VLTGAEPYIATLGRGLDLVALTGHVGGNLFDINSHNDGTVGIAALYVDTTVAFGSNFNET